MKVALIAALAAAALAPSAPSAAPSGCYPCQPTMNQRLPWPISGSKRERPIRASLLPVRTAT